MAEGTRLALEFRTTDLVTSKLKVLTFDQYQAAQLWGEVFASLLPD
jgi:hypothetical protein